MLRITPLSTPTNVPYLRLEGRIVGPWVSELRNLVTEIVSQQTEVRLDLAAVQFVDLEGLTLLRTLQEQGAILQRATPFIEELLRGSQS